MEQCGAFNKVLHPGLNILIPCLCQCVAARMSMRLPRMLPKAPFPISTASVNARALQIASAPKLAMRSSAGRPKLSPVTRAVVRHRADMTYSERMEKTFPHRPISPHVGVYLQANTFPTIAISSITVRATGILLTVGIGGVAGVALVAGNDAVMSLTSSIADSSVGTLAKFSVAFPLSYHYLGSLRHAVWDLTGKGFTNHQMLMSSYALFAASGIMTLALVSYSLPKKEEK